MNMQRANRRRQQGLSLIELMIAMLLGLIVIAGLFNMYLGSSRSSQFSDGLQRMQENGRYGVSTLQRGIRLAGYSPDETIEPFDIAASDDSTLVVQMRRSFDCNGGSTATTDGIAVDTYTLDTSSGDPLTYKLICTGNTPTATPMTLVEGVEAFRVLYGIDANNDDVPERYIPYDVSINALQVSSVRFALLVNSGAPIRSKTVTDNYVLLDTELSKSDRFARTVFTGTVKLRNR